MSAGSPFGMVAGLVRDAMGIVASQSIFERQERITDHVRAYLPASETQRVIEFLGELVGAPFADEWSDPLRSARKNSVLMGDQMRRAWEDWLAGLSQSLPVVLVLEDLHWGDLPSVQFVDTALRVLRERPLFVLALGRPEVLEVFPGLWQGRGLREIPLPPLSREASARVARDVLPDASPAAIARLVERAGGNPFFLEELIRAAVDGEPHSLPETVLAMAQARIEKLSADDRRVLRAASVFGEVFYRAGLAALLGDDAPLDEPLAALATREIIARRPQPEGQEEGSFEAPYAFRHTVVREAAYGMLTDRDRIVAHALAGKWLEQVGDADALTLAEHFERGGEPSRAVGWYARAAEQALEGNDLAAAAARAERGIVCGATGDVLGKLRLLEAEAHSWRGEFKEAQACARKAMKELPPGGPAWYSATAELAKACGRLGHTQKLVDIAEVVNAWEPQDDARDACAVAAATAAVSLFYSGRYELAERLLARAQALGPASATSRGWTMRALATRAMVTGEPAAYLAALEESAQSFDEAGDRRNACYQRVQVGSAEIGIGAYARAEASLRDALQAADRLGLVGLAMSARHNLGIALLRGGKLDFARAEETLARDFFAAQGDRRLEGACRIQLATVLAAQGDLEGAEREAQRAVETLDALPPLRASALATLARVRLARGRGTEALIVARQAHLAVESLGQGEGEALVRLAYVESLVACREFDSAQAAVAVARTRLLVRAARITNEASRRSFLEAVPENARTLELASRWADADLAASTQS
jgi:tetratricopeptide (TPR) repeat protein